MLKRPQGQKRPADVIGNAVLVKRATVIFAVLAAAVGLTSAAAYAWSSDGKGNITCADGSHATVVQDADDNWLISQAGNKGNTDDSYPSEGKAAAHACGE